MLLRISLSLLTRIRPLYEARAQQTIKHVESIHSNVILGISQTKYGHKVMATMRVIGRTREIGRLRFSMVNMSHRKSLFHMMWSNTTSWPPQSDGDRILFWLFFYYWSLYSSMLFYGPSTQLGHFLKDCCWSWQTWSGSVTALQGENKPRLDKYSIMKEKKPQSCETGN